MMIPAKKNNEKEKEKIQNQFKVRPPPPLRSSHFTTLRILKSLRANFERSEGKEFSQISEIISDFDDRFGMAEDCEEALDIMLRHRLVEANNRMESYKERAVEKSNFIYADAVKITPYGVYFLEDLSCSFAYLDLVCFDTGIRDVQLYNDLVRLAGIERNYAINGERILRLDSRLNRVAKFLEYLKAQDEYELETYGLPDTYAISQKLIGLFNAEKTLVLDSAKKNFPSEFSKSDN